MICLVCSGESFKIKFVGGKFIYKCNQCGLEFVEPMPTKEELDNFYMYYHNARAREAVVKKNSKKNIEYLKKYGLHFESNLLDFGCGDNYFIGCVNSPTWKGYDKYTQPNMPEGQFDFITLWGVLEHLTNPIEILKELTKKLKENGKIIITTVGTETIIPYKYKHPEHVTWWNNKSITELFEKCGLKLMEISPYFMYQNPQIYLNCVLNAGRVPEEIQKKITLKTEENVFVPTNEIFIVGKRIDFESKYFS